jgi:hypothetical protein
MLFEFQSTDVDDAHRTLEKANRTTCISTTEQLPRVYMHDGINGALPMVGNIDYAKLYFNTFFKKWQVQSNTHAYISKNSRHIHTTRANME